MRARDAVLAQALFHDIAGADADFLEAMPEPEVEDDSDAPDLVVDLFQPHEVYLTPCSPHALMPPPFSLFPVFALHTVKCKTGFETSAQIREVRLDSKCDDFLTFAPAVVRSRSRRKAEGSGAKRMQRMAAARV